MEGDGRDERVVENVRQRASVVAGSMRAAGTGGREPEPAVTSPATH
jgi:hypothetical protein